MKQKDFFALLSVTMVLLIAALFSPVFLGSSSGVGFSASIIDAFNK